MRFSLQTLFTVVTTAAVGLGGLCLAHNEGRLIKTGKPLDLAIMGEGYFQIELENCSRTLYTRCGNFHRDANGVLVAGTAADRRLLFPTVTFPSGAVPVVTPQGSIHYYWVGQLEREPSDKWLSEVKPLHVLLLGFAVTGGCLLLRELRAQRRELTRLQSLLIAR